MREVRCPSCGRGVSPGKYCIFCGNTLQGAAPTAKTAPDNARPAEKDPNIWDPEAAYRVSKARRLVALLILLLVAVSGVLAYLGQQKENPRPQQTFPLHDDAFPDYGTNSRMTLKEMGDCMEKAGFTRLGDPYTHNGTTYQMFDEFTVLNCRTEYSLAAVSKDGEQAIVHYFGEEKGKTSSSFSQPGKVLKELLTEMLARYGTPEIISFPEAWYWKTENGEKFLLRYIVKDEIELMYGWAFTEEGVI